MSLKDKIISLLSENNNLTDAELTELIYQDKNQHQKTNKACRDLADKNILKRNPSSGGIKNFLLAADSDSKPIYDIAKSKSSIPLKETYNRENELKERFNAFVNKITGKQDNYYAKLSFNDFLDLKLTFQNINSIITYKTTLNFIDWLCSRLNFSEGDKNFLIKTIKEIHPNSSGYDIKIENPKKIIAEVKANNPVTNNRFGSAQNNALIKDIDALLFGKGELKEKGTQDYFKFLVLLSFEEKTEKAIRQLINNYKKRSWHSLKPINDDNVKIYLENSKLTKEKLYIVLI
jgi:hypothetical protein